MPIHVTCQSCQSEFKAPDTAGGKRTACPKCGSVIEIPVAEPVEEIYEAEEAHEPFGGSPPEADVGATALAADRKPCPMCGELIQKDAIKCRFCGEIFDETLAKAERRRGPGGKINESVEEAAERLLAEKQNKTTAIQLFVTSLIGCFSPILAVYGIIFLLRRPYPFPYKGLAIAGTIIHCCWTLLLILSLAIGQHVQ